jgi:predicted dienelactone hydrolase
VLFSHGSCGTPLQSKFLTPLLASWGFVVVAPPHPGNTIFDFPNCNSPANLLAALSERPQDVESVLNQVLAADLDPLSPLFGAIDESRIAMTGHSFGGLTTYLVTAIEPRISVAVAMAPATVFNSTLPVPSLTMLGTIDSVISNPSARAAYDRSVTPKYLVEIEHTGHYAFSDFCLSTSDCSPPTTLTSDEAHTDVLRYVVPFLKTHLAGDAAWSPLLAPPAQPGFVYAAE